MSDSIVLSMGSFWTMAGFGDNDAPRCVERTLAGTTTHDSKLWFGDSAHSKRGAIRGMKSPVVKGEVADWDIYEKFVSYLINQGVRALPEEANVMMVDAPNADSAARKKTAQILFEVLYTPAVFISDSARMSLLMDSVTTGLVVDCGEQVTRIIPVVDGKALRDHMRLMPVGGFELTERFYALLHERFSMTGSSEREMIRDMKEQTCYVAADFDAEMQRHSDGKFPGKDYEAPDASVLTLYSERFRCPELLFQPNDAKLDTPGLHRHVADVIESCDISVRDKLASNVVITGGSGAIRGLDERLQKEVAALLGDQPLSKSLKVRKSDAPKYCAWIGGAVWTMLRSQTQNDIGGCWQSRQDYEEYGPDSIIKKFM